MKQTIEIEVPDGKRAVWEDGAIRFVPNEPHWKSIISWEEALQYVEKNLPECASLIREYLDSKLGSYAHKVLAYRIVVAALTNNEKRHLTIEDKWYPVVQFCRPKDRNNCWGDVLIGTIESEGERYSVVGGCAGGSQAGLGAFNADNGVSNSSATVGFRSVSSKEIAEHISTYFGRLLFEVHYRGTNCDWKWVD